MRVAMGLIMMMLGVLYLALGIFGVIGDLPSMSPGGQVATILIAGISCTVIALFSLSRRYIWVDTLTLDPDMLQPALRQHKRVAGQRFSVIEGGREPPTPTIDK